MSAIVRQDLSIQVGIESIAMELEDPLFCLVGVRAKHFGVMTIVEVDQYICGV